MCGSSKRKAGGKRQVTSHDPIAQSPTVAPGPLLTCCPAPLGFGHLPLGGRFSQRSPLVPDSGLLALS